MTRFTEQDILSCPDCGRNVIRKAVAQIYCPDCSSKRDVERKQKWSKEHPRTRGKEESQQLRDKRRELGREKSLENRTSTAWILDEPNCGKLLRVRIPFDKRFSKNALWNSSSNGHVYMRQEIKDVRDHLISRIQSHNTEWFDGKVWIDIFVEKPNHRFDAVNMVDLICDAVKKGIGIDDNWFCIRRLDWSIVKENPTILVGIAQEVEEHHRCCSNCGSILTLDHFSNKKSDKFHGKSRICRDCDKIVRNSKRS